MKVSTSKLNEVWYVDFGASNHMTNHEEWFFYLEKLEQLEVVEIVEDTPHHIKHIGDAPLSHVGQKGIMRNILHIPTITKNLVSIGQNVDQGIASLVHSLGVLYQTTGQDHCTRAPRREDVYPQGQ